MTGSNDEGAVSVAKREWRAPRLKVLGDAATLTHQSSTSGSDGTGSS